MDTPQPTQQPIHPSQTPPVEPVKQPMKKSMVVPIAMMGAVVLLIAAAFLVGKNYSSLFTPVSSPTPTPVVEASPTAVPVDEMEGWKTYTNTQLGYSFRYPSIFALGKENINTESADGSIEFSTSTDKYDSFVLYISKTTDSLQNYVTEKGDKNVSPVNGYNGDAATIEWFGFYKNAPTHYLSFTKQGYIYSLGFVAPKALTSFIPEETQLLNQILSTFEFVEGSSNGIYSNQVLSFSYPQNWQSANWGVYEERVGCDDVSSRCATEKNVLRVYSYDQKIYQDYTNSEWFNKIDSLTEPWETGKDIFTKLAEGETTEGKRYVIFKQEPSPTFQGEPSVQIVGYILSGDTLHTLILSHFSSDADGLQAMQSIIKTVKIK